MSSKKKNSRWTRMKVIRKNSREEVRVKKKGKWESIRY